LLRGPDPIRWRLPKPIAMQHALEIFLSLAGRHPVAALAFIGLVAFAESLAIVGTLVPAAVVMFGAGALVGHGTLEIGWTLLVATAGAVAGDALSYELGRHGQDRVRQWPLMQRHAGRIEKAQQLIARHGAASILIARFTGAVRAFVPVLAGLGQMPAVKFYATNLASALLWAPAHILPGVVFGASLHLAEQASARLAVIVLCVAVLVWAAVWLARLVVRASLPVSHLLRFGALRAAGERNAWWARFVRLLDPRRPGSEALLAGMMVLLGSMWLFLGILEDVVSRDPLVIADQSVFTFLQQLRTEPIDRLMVGITELGSVGVMLPVIAAVAAWLALRGAWRTAGYWIATTASAELVVRVLKQTLGRHRPLALYRGIEQYSFPSGHATIAAVVLAYLAFLVTRGQTMRWRVGVGCTAAVYVALVGFSRLYLGAHWFSDVLGGYSFGLAVVALSAIIYNHRVQEPVQTKGVAVVAGATIVVAGTLWIWWRGPVDMPRYSAAVPPRPTTLPAWLDGGFRLLPTHRHEIAGERKEVFTVQLACSEPALRQALQRAGWERAPKLSVASVLHAIAPHPSVGKLPVLPKYDGGRASTIDLMRTPSAGGNARDVLRLWRSEWELSDATPIWFGAFYREVQVRPNYSFLRDEPASPLQFASAMVSAGLKLQGTELLSGSGALELWACNSR
jgi:membrane protein DedA with SNARE-associated domain/membrane-associated phospholipid phosphatase